MIDDIRENQRKTMPTAVHDRSPPRKKYELKADKKYELPNMEKLDAYNREVQKNNPFAPKLEISLIPFYEVCEFGYPNEHLLKCLLNNENNHCTTTYYLLQKDHYTIR